MSSMIRPSRRDLMRLAAVAPIAAVAEAGPGSKISVPHPVQLDASRLPFSRYESYWAVSKLWWKFGATEKTPADEWYIRVLEDDASPNELFRLQMITDNEIRPFEGRLTPASLQLSANPECTVEFVIAELDLLRVRGRGCSLRLSAITGPYSYTVQRSPDAWELASVNIPRVLVRATRGSMKVSAQWSDEEQKASCSSITMELKPDDSGSFEGSLEYYDAVPRRQGASVPFDDAVASVQQEFDEFAGTLPVLSEEYERSRGVAAWVLWSSTVGPRGLYRTPIVWASKSWMNRIWSWDHCFVAVGLAPEMSQLAWQQLTLFEAMQDPNSGMLADSISNIQRSWVCTKPPVHGWALSHLLRTMPVPGEQLAQIYEPLRKWTNFWLTERNLDGDGLPCILFDNESFDNTTSNTLFGPVKAPEIAAYLVLQMEALSDVAQRLGHREDAIGWKTRSAAMVDTLVRVLWDSDAGKFVARRVRDGKTAEGDCIFTYVPIVLANRLPERVLKSMIQALRQPGRFLTPYGLATEALNSPRYDPASYVKGPVWAPPCTFISEGLAAVGQKALASQIRRSFMSNCVQHGMSEHFDAKTGLPAGDPGYNWTAAMFLHFAREERLLA